MGVVVYARKVIYMKKGFTIVELLIVIVVIGILAAITVVAYTGVQERSKTAKVSTELAQLEKAIRSATTLSGKTLVGLTAPLGTNSTGTGRNCWNQPNGTDLSALAKTHGCWTDYFTTLDIISTASGTNVRNLVDPWGRPYYIDQSEGEYADPCQAPDRISIYRRPHVNGYQGYDTSYVRVLPFIAAC